MNFNFYICVVLYTASIWYWNRIVDFDELTSYLFGDVSMDIFNPVKNKNLFLRNKYEHKNNFYFSHSFHKNDYFTCNLFPVQQILFNIVIKMTRSKWNNYFYKKLRKVKDNNETWIFRLNETVKKFVDD